MRFWLFHPAIFYPLVLALAVLAIGISLKPQLLPRPASAAAATIDGGSVLIERDGFNSPYDPPEQNVTVVRNFWGQPQSLRIAALPHAGLPTDAERGVEIRLRPDVAQLLSERRLVIEVTYHPLTVNAAPTLAVAALNDAPTHWVSRDIPPLQGRVNFELPRQANIQGIGLRAIHNDDDIAYGVEIISIRITPRG